ncbi:MAG: RNA polymerase sigma factor [Candidatus Eremiobacteraeota bacterium]|nr:RNA polymerase sigma factor [Candidatus Eremiobacteraeota bacterium]
MSALAPAAPAPPDPDATLAAELADDVDRAFEAVVVAYRDAIVAFVARMLRDDERAEDVAQEVFVRAYRALRTYAPERRAALHLRSWLYAIAHNMTRNAVRDAGPWFDEPLQYDDGEPRASLADPAAGPENDVLRAEAWDRVTAAIARLSPALRAAFVMRYVDEIPYDEIAAALQRPVGTVKASAHRGLLAVRAFLEESDG